MILKADPDKILRFISENFELVRALYLAQLAGNVISREQFNALTRHTGDISINRLFEYKLLTEQYDDIRLNEPVRAFLAFLISEFRPLLPSEPRRRGRRTSRPPTPGAMPRHCRRHRRP